MESKINHIIAHVLNGEASSEDILTLSEWLNGNEKNREEFLRLKNYWDAEVTFNSTIAPALSAEKLEQTLERQIRKNKRILFGWKSFSITAAISAFIILSVVSVMNYSGYRTTEYYTYLTDQHKSSFTMDDGTIVTLNKNSRLSFTNAYGKKERSVKLEGEAYFDVAKKASKPFNVDINGASITVLGTHFNVKADIGSDNITTTLVEGSIRFESGSQHIIMTPDQQLTFSRTTNKIDIKYVDTEPVIAWKDDLLKYKSIPFIELIQELQSIYKVEIRIDSQKLMDPTVTVSGTFGKNQSIEQILKVISRSLPIRWNNSDGVYYIRYVTLKR